MDRDEMREKTMSTKLVVSVFFFLPFSPLLIQIFSEIKNLYFSYEFLGTWNSMGR